LASFLLPLDASAIYELNLVVPVVLEGPVRVGGEPVVVIAVEDDGGVGRDAAAAQKLRERVLRRDVARYLVLQVTLPVPAESAVDVALLVHGRVDVDLDQAKAVVLGVLGYPLGGYQSLDLCL